MPVQEPTRDRLIHLDEIEAPKPLRRPDYLKVRAPSGETYQWLQGLMRSKSLHTVCEEAMCPNIGECWGAGTATFLMMGAFCTPTSGFSAINHSPPPPPPFHHPHPLTKP